MNEDDYRIVARALFDTQRDARKLCAQIQADYGKWLTATICALNFGAIYLIANLQGVDNSSKIAPIMILIVGLCSALTCGMFAWNNWQKNTHYFETWDDPTFLVDRTRWPEADADAVSEINRTYRASILFGVVAILSIPVSALVLWRNLGLI